MATMVNRLYPSLTEAEAVRNALLEAGALARDVIVTEAADSAALARLGIPARGAPAVLEAMAKGAVLVTGIAPMGSAVDFIEVMDTGGPLATAGIEEEDSRTAYSPGAIFSEVIGIPPLGGSGDLFSRWIGWPTLSTPGPMMLQDLPDSRAPYRPTIPLPLLSGGEAPYKGITGSNLLSGTGPYKPLIPLPLLSGGEAPYKGFLGLPLLSRTKRFLYK